ncbi:DUF4190 domain-containing protein [Phycisphaera mikurensis]|uniref:DUF4190 domain-containing protein n=1 Tax=Phycisphaera mikurensis (strain NBRC 102666 / KCTC 22515 / FYK2301M01) TaxID=1142394 RepID=I0ID71_PHYMF|nr:DUF4190 domain-containing protein [Phycisphaera mikurensis]MBB6442335.1 hypothetical protein [Phycisphaera mikurensis]BAM03209.1 hypothetical protein PSMK_10500 [Phycisphaera mikurensis NBRC 102666]
MDRRDEEFLSRRGLDDRFDRSEHAEREATRPGTSRLAIASLALGIVGLVTACFLVGVPIGVVAVVLGVVALFRVGRPGQRAGGRGLAVAGVVLGSITTLLAVAIGVAMVGPVVEITRSAVQQAEATQQARALAEAIQRATDDAGPGAARVTDPAALLAGGHLPDPAVFLTPSGPAAELPAGFAALPLEQQARFLRVHASLIPVPLPADASPDAIAVFSVPNLWPALEQLALAAPGQTAGTFVVATAGGSPRVEADADAVAASVRTSTGKRLAEVVADFRRGG